MEQSALLAVRQKSGVTLDQGIVLTNMDNGERRADEGRGEKPSKFLTNQKYSIGWNHLEMCEVISLGYQIKWLKPDMYYRVHVDIGVCGFLLQVGLLRGMTKMS